MALGTKIEWTDATWNPIRARHLNTGRKGHYCEMVSPGCANCYASNFQPRFGLPVYTGAAHREEHFKEVEVFLDNRVLLEVFGWKKEKRVFVCSMTDLFGEWIPDEVIDRVFAVMALTPRHVYQVLTKRADRMHAYLRAPERKLRMAEQTMYISNKLAEASNTYKARLTLDEVSAAFKGGGFFSNVCLGVSIENDEYRWRAAYLMHTPAALRFVSAEPLLGPLTLDKPFFWKGRGFARTIEVNPLHGITAIPDCDLNCGRIDWVIVGGESGPGARPCNVGDVRSLVRQCRSATVPVFVKQLGAKPMLFAEPLPQHQDSLSLMQHGEYDPEPLALKLLSHKGGNMEEWPEDLRIREFPQ